MKFVVSTVFEDRGIAAPCLLQCVSQNWKVTECLFRVDAKRKPGDDSIVPGEPFVIDARRSEWIAKDVTQDVRNRSANLGNSFWHIHLRTYLLTASDHCPCNIDASNAILRSIATATDERLLRFRSQCQIDCMGDCRSGILVCIPRSSPDYSSAYLRSASGRRGSAVSLFNCRIVTRRAHRPLTPMRRTNS